MELSVFEDESAFSDLMASVDQELASDGFAIPQRPLNALRVVATRFQIPLPFNPPNHGSQQHESAHYWPISNRIYEWYDARFGDRLKIDFAPGRMVIRISHDLWVFRFPRIWGAANLIASRTEKNDRFRTDGRPVTVNVVNSIEGLPEGLRLSLTDQHLRTIFDDFVLGYAVFSRLEPHRGEKLVEAALADISAAVDHLVGSHPNFGLSKWSSLQAAEKLLKFAITKAGGSYPQNHNLGSLITRALEHGVSLNLDWEISRIQCKAGIRYGDEACTREQAFEAHYASFRLALVVALALERLNER
jgi:HEPN domain-containing protein